MARALAREGLGVGVVAIEIVMDRLLQFGHAPERTAADALLRDLGEEALDEIEPGGAGRRGVHDRLEPGSVRRPHVNADVVSPHGRTLTDLRPLGNSSARWRTLETQSQRADNRKPVVKLLRSKVPVPI